MICFMLQYGIMPELPEVEIIKRGLERTILRKKITGIEVREKKILVGDYGKILRKTVIAVRRFGKGLIIDFENGYSLTAHVKMTGQFIHSSSEKIKNFHPTLVQPQILPNKHTHVIFSLITTENQTETLFYNDIRKFGWIKVVKTDKIFEEQFFKALGPEPLSTLTQDYFLKILSKSSMPVKMLLMDQSKVSGIGNIYANDSLFAARIDPRRKSNTLTSREGKRLFTAIVAVLEKGLVYGGASKTNYVNVDGGKGEYQNHFLVYGKDGKVCPNCGDKIIKIMQSGRSSFYCPRCQK